MATDYKKIAEENQVRYGSDPEYRRFFYEQLYKEKTHFVYEFIQNAVDSKSSQLELRLKENELFVWNDGDQFSEKDVRSICSLGSSSKDLTQIGTFGIGFKSVYNYTDYPEIYSGDEHFRIRDLTQPEGIDKMTPQIVEQVSQGRTVFRLPFKDDLSQEDIVLLKDQFCKLGERRVLLFLRDLQRDCKRHFKTIRWIDERDGQTGICSCIHQPHSKIQDASEVELTMSLNSENQLSEMFLVFHKAVQPPQDVIDALLKQTKHDEKRQKIQQSAKKRQPIEIAFKLHDGSITVMDDNCVLFAYLPTQKETHLKFLIQARYQTTSGRADIQEPSENPWNRWLVRETAKFLPEILEQLKASDLLEPAFFNVLPLKSDVENEFKPITEALQKAMQERAFVPTQSGGYAKAESVFHVNSKGVAIPRGIEYRYAKVQNVYYPHVEILRQLIENNWLHSESNWLHPEIRNTEEFRQCFKVMQEAGVKLVGVSRVLDWLEERGSDWFKSRSNKWLSFLYTYLKEQGSQLDRIKKLPLIRLENGQHVCANIELICFPPSTEKGRKEIEPFLSDLPILQSVLLEGEERNEIEAFLKRLGVRTLRSVVLILEGICPQYRKFPKPSAEKNRLHVRYLFKVWNDVSESERSELKKQISEIPILRGYKRVRHEADSKSQNSVTEFRYVKPRDTYLPEAYIGDADLEIYFSVYGGDIWFVDDAYLEDKSDVKAWFQFLKAIGSMDTPCIIEKTIRANSEGDQEFDKELDNRNIKGQWKRSTWWQQTNIEDFRLQGLSEILAEINKDKKVNFSQVCWSLLVKVLPSGQRARNAFFQGIYHRYYYSNRSDPFEAIFYRQLKETPWLPDEQGDFHLPSECFVPTSENRRVLGDSVAYLHPDFDIRTEPAQWLAEKLGVRLKPDTENVLNYLQKLSNSTEVSVAKVEPLYRFLQREVEGARLQDKFKKESLIFTSNPEPRWWRSDEVFWEDESDVFENDRDYLKTYYPATLKSFFIDLGVSEQASQQDYACGIQEIATTEQAENKKVRERVQKFYKCLDAWRVEKQEIIYDSKCWLGKNGDEWGFFTRRELVLKDHPHIGEIFEGEVPFWTFDRDLSSLARNLKVARCSQAQVEFHPEGNKEKDKKDTDWSEKVQNLRPYIHAFLNSPRLCEESDISMFLGNYEEPQKEKFAKFSTNCSVRRVKELRVTYELKGTSVTDPNPRQSFLDVTDQPAKLWLGLKENEDDYAELIGDALQDYFGVQELGRFVEDLLTPTKKQDRVLSNWKRKGLETKFLDENPKDDGKRQIESLDEEFPDEPNSGDTDSAAHESDTRISTDSETPKTDSEDNESLADKVDESEIHLSSNGNDDSRTDGPEIETSTDSETTDIDESDDDSTSDKSENHANSASKITDISSRDTQSLTKVDSGVTQSVKGESESEPPTVHEDPETDNKNDDSTENKSETTSYQPRPGGSGTPPRGGKGINTPSGNRGTGHSSGRSDGTEDNTHMEETGTSPHARKEVEDAGMKHAHRYEKKEGRTPKDVSSERRRGYDIYSTSPDGKNRCIEVKARDNHDFVALTSNEWSVAKQLKDTYFLYVVLNARTQPELYIIQNPADKVAVDERYDVRYQVPLSEIEEHGILV